MKIKTLTVTVLLIAAALNSCYARPVAVFEQTEHDFGQVKKSTSVTHIFHFSNRGTSKLIIERVKSG